ncbi:MAG TPA: hypothetical protein VFD58_29375 [Blastocatellia bacterium]|nr:hypothetical protein [Blastocatellia bacterium]
MQLLPARAVLTGLVLLAISSTASGPDYAKPSPHHHTTAIPRPISPQCGVHCGTERWAVKTLSDDDAGDVDFDPRSHTVRFLRNRIRPSRFPATRIPGIEFQTFRVRALLIGFKKEDDRDFHVVIADRRNRAETMIIEFPDSDCSGFCSSVQQAQMRAARQAFIDRFGDLPAGFRRLTERVEVLIKGVGFFDRFHHQTGVARPSGLEIHPVLSFTVVE